MKKIWISLLSLSFLLAQTACGSTSNNDISSSETETTIQTEDAEPEKNGKLSITMLDVGKADAFVLQSENHTVVIDTGTKKKGKSLVNYLESLEVQKVDTLIITHFDQDHVGGAEKLLKKMEVDQILVPDYQDNGEEYQDFCKEMEEQGKSPTVLSDVYSFTLDSVEYVCYPPEEERYGSGDCNDMSIITAVSCNSYSALFTGDAIEKRLEEFMNHDFGTFDILKIPYHGRNIANLGAFLDSVQPKYALVSSNEEEFCTRTKMLLEDRDIPYYASYHGMVTIDISDTIEIKQETTES